MLENVIVLIGGGHVSGKTTLAHWIKKDIESLPDYNPETLQIQVVDLQKYAENTGPNCQQLSLQEPASAISIRKPAIDVPKPARFRFDALKQDLQSAVLSSPNSSQTIIIVHGLYALYDKQLREMSHLKVYVDSDADTRLIRWIRRDVLPGKAGLSEVISSYLYGAKQEMADFIFPTKEYADIVVPRGAEITGVSLILDGILPHLGMGGLTHPTAVSSLRPFENERFDTQKGGFYGL